MSNRRSVTVQLTNHPTPSSYTSRGELATTYDSNASNSNNGTASAGAGSGWEYPPYVIDLLAALSFDAREAGYDINFHTAAPVDLTAAQMQAAASELALVSINAFRREGNDGQNLTI